MVIETEVMTKRPNMGSILYPLSPHKMFGNGGSIFKNWVQQLFGPTNIFSKVSVEMGDNFYKLEAEVMIKGHQSRPKKGSIRRPLTPQLSQDVRKRHMFLKAELRCRTEDHLITYFLNI
jgi:hypothetical protein